MRFRSRLFSVINVTSIQRQKKQTKSIRILSFEKWPYRFCNMIENSVKQIIKDLIFYQWRLSLHWSKTFPTNSGKIFPTLKESEQLPVQLCPFSVYTGWHWQSCDPTVFMQVALKRQEWLPSHSSISKKLQIEGDLIIMQTSLYISRLWKRLALRKF